MRLLLDCDGILANFHEIYLHVVEKFTGVHLESDQCTTWDILKFIGHEDKDENIKSYIEWNKLCLKIAPYEGAKEFLEKIQKLYEVVIVTAPMSTQTWCYERTKWLKEQFNIPKSKIVFTNSKHYVQGDAFVDDSLENCQKWANHNQGEVYLWDRPWNRKRKNMGRIQVINNWNDLMEKLTT